MERYYNKYIRAMRKKSGIQTVSQCCSSSDAVESVSPQQHYSVVKKDRDHIDLYTFAGKCAGDPALNVSNIINYCTPH